MARGRRSRGGGRHSHSFRCMPACFGSPSDFYHEDGIMRGDLCSKTEQKQVQQSIFWSWWGDFFRANRKKEKNRPKEVVLDRDLWSRLPPELIERVMAWLPLREIFRMRTVCKRWNSLVSCPKFIDIMESEPRRRRNWLLLCRGAGSPILCVAYDLCSRNWYELSLSFLPSGIRAIKASKGLLLCTLDEAMFVCNILTKSWAELPLIQNATFLRVVGMAVHDSRKSYKVVVIGCSGTDFSSSAIEIFDSATNLWRLVGKLPKGLLLYPGKMTLCKGKLFCIASRPFLVAAYDLELEIWDEIDLPDQLYLACPWLVECNGILMMVACVKDRLNENQQSIIICKFLQKTGDWLEVAIMPDRLCEEVLNSSQQAQFSCVGLDGHIFLCATHNLQVLAYDLGSDLWSWLPCCPFATHDQRDESMVGFDFDPGLDVPCPVKKRDYFASSALAVACVKNEYK